MKMMRMKLLLVAVEVACLVSGIFSFGSQTLSQLSFLENGVVSTRPSSTQPQPLMVDLTLIQEALSKGAGLSLSLSLSQLIFFKWFLCVMCFLLKTAF